MRAASAAMLAAAVFFAGVMAGGRGVPREGPPPTPVVLVEADSASVGPTPSPRRTPLEVEEVPREVQEGSIEDYDDRDDDDSSAPGSDDDSSGPGSDDSSGPGSGDDREEDEREERDDDSSGPGSDDSGSGSDDDD